MTSRWAPAGEERALQAALRLGIPPVEQGEQSLMPFGTLIILSWLFLKNERLRKNVDSPHKGGPAPQEMSHRKHV